MKRIWLFVLLLAIVFCNSSCNSNSIPDYLSENEKIIDLSTDFSNVCAVTDEGNVYYMGADSYNDMNNGISNTTLFNYGNTVLGEKFVRIYDHGDAVKVEYNLNGGIIISEDNDLYLFLNEKNDKFQTPEYLCSGYKDAQLFTDHMIFVLKENYDFGYITADYPDQFHLIAPDCKKFRLVDTYEKRAVFFLTNDNRLYIFDYFKNFDFSEEHFEHVLDFDVLKETYTQSVFCYLDENNDAFLSIGDYSFSTESILEYGLEKVEGKTTSVIAYGQGVALLDDSMDLSIYGSDLKSWDYYNFDYSFKGEKVLRDIKAVSGSAKGLCVAKSDGSFTRYGSNGDNTRTPIVPDY